MNRILNHYTTALGLLFYTLALPATESEPTIDQIVVTAERLDLNRQSGAHSLSGNVVITDPEYSITADTVEVNLINGAISRIYATGSPVRFRQQLANGETVQTESAEIDYVTSKWTLVFRGNVSLRRGNWHLDGGVIEYNIRNRNVVATGGLSTGPANEQTRPRVSFTYNQ